MKNSFHVILALTIVGLLALVIAAFYFGAPLFGWIIMAAIFAVFVGEQLVANESNPILVVSDFPGYKVRPSLCNTTACHLTNHVDIRPLKLSSNCFR